MSLYLFYILLCILPFSIPFQVPLRSSDKSPFDKAFDALASETLERWSMPGLAIAVIDGNKTFSKGYGIERFPDKPVTPSTLFYTGSTTKSFTAAAISILIDDRANTSTPLTWQSPLASILGSDFVLQDPWTTTHVTLEDALSHRTGQPGHDFSWLSLNDSLRDVVHKFRHLPPTAEIRTKWQYCNMMYITVSYFIEKLTGLWLGHFLQTRIYDPLNMSSTFFSLSDAKAAADAGTASLAQGYVWVNWTQSYQSLSYMDSPVASGAGATISTVIDYTKWLRCLMTMSPPLSPAGHAALRFPRTTRAQIFGDAGFGEFDFYSLGLEISFYHGELLFWHTGGLPGFKTFMAFLPNMQWGIVTMVNTMEGVADEILAFSLIDDLLGVPLSERFDRGKQTEAILQQRTYMLQHAGKIGYPHTPNPPIPLTLPLSEYAGLYTHPVYPPLNLTLTPPQARLSTLSYHHLNGDPIYISFSHVSGDFFLVWARPYAVAEPEESDWRPWIDIVTKGEFRIGESGRVKQLGVNIEPEMGEKKIWWEKLG